MVRRYWFWLIVVSIGVFLLERLFPWRKRQPVLRPLLGQDLFWIVFNGYIWGVILSALFRYLRTPAGGSVADMLGGLNARMSVIGGLPLYVQAIGYLVVADFIEWCVHNALHRIGPLWRIHRIHHSIHTMDWIGNFRFHWGELIVYGSIKYLPLALLGARYEAMLIAWVTATTIGHLNHANIDISWGPLRYVLNSSRMHIWHHDRYPDKAHGYNFAVVFSAWDWLFGTAYMPPGKNPKELGFKKDERLPDGLIPRFFAPWHDQKFPAQAS